MDQLITSILLVVVLIVLIVLIVYNMKEIPTPTVLLKPTPTVLLKPTPTVTRKVESTDGLIKKSANDNSNTAHRVSSPAAGGSIPWGDNNKTYNWVGVGIRGLEVYHRVYIFDNKTEDPIYKLSHIFTNENSIKGIINFENENQDDKATIVYDFKKTTTLSEVRLWNIPDGNNESFGIKNIDVEHWNNSKNQWVKIDWISGSGYHDDTQLSDNNNIIKFKPASATHWKFVLSPKNLGQKGVGLRELELWGPPNSASKNTKSGASDGPSNCQILTKPTVAFSYSDNSWDEMFPPIYMT